MGLIQPVILSGGSGTRLWPASRAMYPKQLLPLIGERTMLQNTVLRLNGKANLAKHFLVVCNEAHRFLVAEQLRVIGVPAKILLEPDGRNTAPAAALAALLALRETKERESPPLLLVMPADHVIQDKAAFLEAIETGEAGANDGKLVTYGVIPTHPNTGFGYIEVDVRSENAAPIKSFIEKPERATAVKLISTNRCFWNAGIFLFRADSYINELSRYAPDMVAACVQAIDESKSYNNFIFPDPAAFRACPADSIDYAVMEKTDNAFVVPLEAGWSDVGSWAALHDVSTQDQDGNTLAGDVIAHGCEDSYVSAKSRLVAAIGLKDIIVVEDQDTVLVVHKNKSQDVRAIVDELKLRGRSETEVHRRVFRPWGSYDSIDSDDGFQVKRLIVNPGAVLSLQKHAHRAEHWTVVRGSAHITLDEKEFDLNVNESTYIPIGAVHRIANVTDEPVHVIEVQCGDYLGEDDIVRLEDNYGRKGTNT